MRVIICGSRSVAALADIARAVALSGFTVTAVISGGARGADQLGEQWATAQGLPFQKFPAQWAKYGKRAGMLRNVAMAEKAEAVIAVWDGRSSGTSHMIDYSRKLGLPVYVHHV